MKSSGELKISWRTTCADVSVLWFKTDKYEKEEIVIEDWFSLQNRVSTFEDTSAFESDETLTLSRNDVIGELLPEWQCYNPKKNDGRFVKETTMSIVPLDAWVVTMVRYLEQKQNRTKQIQKKYAEMYGRMVEAGTR